MITDCNRYLILFVEDEEPLADLFVRFLAGENFTVTAVGTLKEGIEKVRREPFEAVILDLNLPDSRGVATLKRFLEVTGHIVPVIVYSGAGDELARECLALGAQEFLTKPRFSAEVIKRVIDHSIARVDYQRSLLAGEHTAKRLDGDSPLDRLGKSIRRIAALAHEP